MKKGLILIAALLFVFIGTGIGFAADNDVQELERTHPAERQMEWFCPWCGIGPSKQGSHMMRSRTMDQDMSGGAYCQQRQLKQPLTEPEARKLMDNYVAFNPNLKIGDVTEKDDLFVGNVVTREGSLVEKLVINKNNGWMRVEY